MPQAFNECRKKGGRIRTISGPNKSAGLSKNQYLHICILNGKVYRGEIKTKKEK